MKRTSPEWHDPTGNDAVFKTTRSLKPESITSNKEVLPLSKFDDDSAWKGRRRLLRDLNKELAKIPRGFDQWKRIRRDISALEAQQFISRVTPEEALKFTNSKRQRLKKLR